MEREGRSVVTVRPCLPAGGSADDKYCSGEGSLIRVSRDTFRFAYLSGPELGLDSNYLCIETRSRLAFGAAQELII